MFEEVKFGKYKLVKKIAASGSAEIFLATPTDDRSRRMVVVKKLLPETASIDTFTDLMRNEATLGKVMNHPNIVNIFECGSVNDDIYLSMEYVDGLDLWRCLRRTKKVGKHLTEIQTLYILVEVLKALEYLHNLVDEKGNKLNIVHHDVSPSNILISRIGEIKLGDFGISFSQHKDLPDSERKMRFRGKVHYISPEQIKGQVANYKSDIFSAGVVMAELLTGRKPFEGPTDLSILINIKDGRSSVISEARDKLPKQLFNIMNRALKNNPDERYPSAKDMRGAIEAYADSEKLVEAGIELGEHVSRLVQEYEKKAASRMSLLSGPRVQVEDEETLPPISPEDIKKITHSAAPALSEQEVAAITRATMPGESKEYVVKKVTGELPDAMQLSTVVEDIIADRLTEDTLVSVDGGNEFMPLGTIPELARHLPCVTPTARFHNLGPPDAKGMLGDEAVPRIFLEFFNRKSTGLLIFECTSIRKELFLEEGCPIYASSNLAGELLGEFLVGKGTITRMELELALAMMDRFNGHLGDTLIGLDILDSITLLNAITEQIKMRIYDLFTWVNGTYSFYKNAKYVKESFKLAADPLELIKDGFLTSCDKETVDQWFEESKNNLFQLNDNVSIIDDWKIEVPYRNILGILEKPSPLYEIIESVPTLDDDSIFRLKKLFLFGIEIGFIKEIK